MKSRVAILLLAVGLMAIATVIVAPHPIPQDQRYHDFADKRAFAGIPNFGNVASNVVFVVAGLVGLATLPRVRGGTTLCIGAILTGVGSAVYHWSPSDASLVVDRLGMVVALAAFIALLMSEFDIASSAVAFPLLLIAGVGSVLYWVFLQDLRPYALFQGFPLLLFVLGSALFPRTHTRHGMLWLATGGYVLAKICEAVDRTIYDIGRVVSGHTLKHLVAGAALWITIVWLGRRKPSTVTAPR